MQRGELSSSSRKDRRRKKTGSKIDDTTIDSSTEEIREALFKDASVQTDDDVYFLPNAQLELSQKTLIDQLKKDRDESNRRLASIRTNILNLLMDSSDPFNKSSSF